MGWVVRQEDPGRILAEILVRSQPGGHRDRLFGEAVQHHVQDSDTLLHDGSMIHRNYNEWIKLLERETGQYVSQA